jgi:hypothetical protein
MDNQKPEKQVITTLNVNLEDENRLRFLALELAKGIEEPEIILKRLGWNEDDYDEIKQSRVFKAMLRTYSEEWQGASNTQKRVRLKSAVNIEAALPDFYTAMINPNEPLMARVKTLEILGKLGGLGGSETIAGQNGVGGNGQYFKLEIHMDRDRPPIIIDGGTLSRVETGEPALGPAPEGEPNLTPESIKLGQSTLSSSSLSQSSLLNDVEWEDLSVDNLKEELEKTRKQSQKLTLPEFFGKPGKPFIPEE